MFIMLEQPIEHPFVKIELGIVTYTIWDTIGVLMGVQCKNISKSDQSWIGITALFRSIIVLCGTDNILQNIPIFRLNMIGYGNILQNIVSPTKHCYECEKCYDQTQ